MMTLSFSYKNWKYKLIQTFRQTLSWGEHKLPPGLRSLVGVLFVVAGIFGFLPVLGFWMIPVGAAFIGLDIPPLRRRLRQWLAETSPARETRPTLQRSNKAAEEFHNTYEGKKERRAPY